MKESTEELSECGHDFVKKNLPVLKAPVQGDYTGPAPIIFLPVRVLKEKKISLSYKLIINMPSKSTNHYK